MIRTRLLKRQILEESQYTQKVQEWFVSTYTAEQIDSCIRAVTDSPYTSAAELVNQRITLIRNYLDREYDFQEEAWLNYLTREIYISIYEKPMLRRDEKTPAEASAGTGG